MTVTTMLERTDTASTPLRVSLLVIGASQLGFGALFLLVPSIARHLFGLTPDAPAWAHWLNVMLAARFLGYAAGMFVASRAPRRHVAWINTMIFVQLVDWVATLYYLSTGDLTFRQVSTACALPVVFIAPLLWWHPRRDGARA
ncbi:MULTISPECIES: hypothetical protein [Pseudofrankia]|uniref:hypothetical protein n=1 Tax=Pseudofrankia TaxID=2994363 RepID=UPI000234CA4C|nr:MULTISPECIES: hypothetical protein [Pseudofrankia]OHV41515.1 hypothetical protein BCD49_00725 [Pseudofrankia sp. EUN1h]